MVELVEVGLFRNLQVDGDTVGYQLVSATKIPLLGGKVFLRPQSTFGRLARDTHWVAADG